MPAERRPRGVQQARGSRARRAEEAAGGVLPRRRERGGDDARAGRIEATDDRGLWLRHRQPAAAPRSGAPGGGLCRRRPQPPVHRAVGETSPRRRLDQRSIPGGSRRGVHGPV